MTNTLAPFRISVCGIEELTGHCEVGVSHVLSILDPDWPVPEAFGAFGEHSRLELRFHDVIDAQEFIENNVSDRISVEDLALKFAIGKRNFERRFKKATNNTPVEYMQRVKIEAAKKSFETSRKNVAEVMYDVGYSDTKAFRTVFKKITGLSPIDYRNKYGKVGLVAL